MHIDKLMLKCYNNIIKSYENLALLLDFIRGGNDMKFKKYSLITAFILALSSLAPISASVYVKADNSRNEIYSEDFESDLPIEPAPENGPDERIWYTFGTPHAEKNTENYFDDNNSGKKSLKITQRANSFDGPAINLTNMIKPGIEYSFSIMVYQETGIAQPVTMSTKVVKSAQTGDEYSNLNSITVASGEWTELTGSFLFPEADENFPDKNYSLYIETPNSASNYDFYVDNFSITAPEGEELISDGNSNGQSLSGDFKLEASNVPTGNSKYLLDFEKDSSSANFIPRLNESIMVSNEEANNNGSHSLYIYDRNNSTEGPVLKTDFLEPGTRYDFSADVLFKDDISTGEAAFEANLFYDQDGKTYCEQIDIQTVKQNKWTTLSGSIQLPENSSEGYLLIHTVADINNPDQSSEGSEDGLLSFYLDNVIFSDSVSSDMNKIFILIFIVTLVAISVTILILVLKKTKGSKQNTSASPNLSDTDIMTPTKNKKAYEDKIFDLINHPENCKNINIALCDINRLQYINDNYSREKGDEAIIRCAKALVKAVGKKGTVYRTSGDEFMCISEESLKEDIIRELQAEVQNYHGYPFSIASGFASYDSKTDGESPDIRNIIIRADEALSENKQNVKDPESH